MYLNTLRRAAWRFSNESCLVHSQDARDYVDRIEGKKVVLIDGEQLTQLLIDHKVGVAVRRTYELVDISQDFFDEEG